MKKRVNLIGCHTEVNSVREPRRYAYSAIHGNYQVAKDGLGASISETLLSRKSIMRVARGGQATDSLKGYSSPIGVKLILSTYPLGCGRDFDYRCALAHALGINRASEVYNV